MKMKIGERKQRGRQEWIKKDEEIRVVEGVTRDVLNSARQTRKKDKQKDERN